MSNSKRTRSQLLLPRFDFDLGRSPLKHARTAIRNHRESLETVAAPSSNDETLISSAKSASKRPSSPIKDAALERERELKRAKFNGFEAENSVTQASSSTNVQLTHKPSSMSSAEVKKPDIAFFFRSRSVPLSSSGWMPHIDLNMVPPSPSKKVKLRIASVPPLTSDYMQVDQPEPPTVVVTLAKDRPLSPFLREPSSDLTPPPSSSPLRAAFMQPPSKRESPIPLSPTPVSARLPSRLPRPSSSANLVPSRVPVKRPRGAKSKAAAPVVPRMTRARKRESDEKAKEAETHVESAAPNEHLVPSVTKDPLSEGGKQSGSTSIPATNHSDAPASSTSLIPITPRRRSRSFSFAQPTASSVAKAKAASPIKTRVSAVPRLSAVGRGALSNLSMALEKLNMPPPSRPNTSMGFNRDAGDSNDSGIETRPKSTAVAEPTAVTTKSTIMKPNALKRANTVGALTAKEKEKEREKGMEKRQSTLMLPPPIPVNRKTVINLASGIVAGTPKGLPKFGVGPSGPRDGNGRRIFPVGASGRVMHKASKKSSLPTVLGSPVKGNGGGETEIEEETVSIEREAAIGSSSRLSNGHQLEEDVMHAESDRGTLAEDEAAGSSKGKERERPADAWRHNASRRASTASQLLSQSLSAMPQTPPRASKTARAASSSWVEKKKDRDLVGMHTAPGALGKLGGSGAHVSAQGKGGGSTSAAAASSTAASSTSATTATGSVRVLKQCVIFVDVRTDDGDDAGGLFVDMLRGMGAKISSRVGQKCTHIVFKNGLMSTLTRYRLLHEPRPIVVGIAWVVECAEQRSRVDETKFLVDLEGVNVAGTNKRRRSMLPKLLHPDSPGAHQVAVPAPSGDVQSRHTRAMIIDEKSSSPVPVEDKLNTSGSSIAEDDLPPLEKARRRRSMMFGR